MRLPVSYLSPMVFPSSSSNYFQSLVDILVSHILNANLTQHFTFLVTSSIVPVGGYPEGVRHSAAIQAVGTIPRASGHRCAWYEINATTQHLGGTARGTELEPLAQDLGHACIV